MGQGDIGQLGLGDNILERKKPAIVPGLEGKKMIQITCGGMHTVALTNTGEVGVLSHKCHFSLFSFSLSTYAFLFSSFLLLLRPYFFLSRFLFSM